MIRVLLGMIFVLLLSLAGLRWMQTRYDDRRDELARAESAQVDGATRQPGAAPAAVDTTPLATAEPPAPLSGIGYGLSFALAADSTDEAAHLACQGEPPPQDRPREGTCDPYRGDTSCRAVLPIACVRERDALAGATLGATQPLMGAVVHSAEEGTARCAAELGEGWRMAEFHDSGGWDVRGRRGIGLRAGTRYWVRINDQRGNCWDSPR